MSAPVIIEPYDPQWTVRYDEERDRIAAAVGEWIIALEHVGSTAVEGLPAKPIIDIMAGVRTLKNVAHCIPRLAEIGYEYVPEFELAIPDRRFFRKGPAGGRTHHLHVVVLGSEFWERHLLFRDYLRAHPDVAQEYAALKYDLAARFGSDRSGYSEAKTDFVKGVEAAARSGTR